MIKLTAIFFVLFSLAACNRGWAPGDRDKLINSCVEKAQAGAAGIDVTKLKNYCSCYQQNLEKKYPTMRDLSKATPDQLTNEAQACLPLMVQ